MAARLHGPLLLPQGALPIPSELILRCSVQVAEDGLVTMMLADQGTTGGYPKIATSSRTILTGLCNCGLLMRFGPS